MAGSGPSGGDRSPERDGRPSAGERRRDVVIVGAGLAGLTAATELRHRDVLLLEADDRVGGRIRSEPRDPYWLNHGAHLFGGPATAIGGLIDRYGLDARDVEASFTGVAMRGRLIERGSPLRLLARMPLSWRGRLALARAGARVLRHTGAYRAFAARRPGETDAELNRRLHDFMNDRSFAQLLGPLPADADALFRAISNRAQGAPEDLAAGGALSAFALVFARSAALGRNIIGGAGLLAEAMHRDHDATVSLSSRVTAIEQSDDGVTVNYASPEGLRRIMARAAIVTAPPPAAAAIVRGLPEDTANALREIRYGPSIVMALLTGESGPVPWDDIYAAVVPGASFNMFFNQAAVLRTRDEPRRRGGSLMVYASGDLGRALAQESDATIRDRFLRDLHAVFPDTRSIVEEVAITRWDYATAFPHPGRAALQSALERPLGRIALAGDYLGAWFTDSAVITAREAVRRVEAHLEADGLPPLERSPVPAAGGEGAAGELVD